MGVEKTYGPEIEEEILSRLAMGESLRRVCATEGMPAPSTVIKWAMGFDNSRPGFGEQYLRARAVGAQLLIDEVTDISDDGSNDFMEKENGGKVVDHEHIQRSKLRIDTRKWLASKVLPKLYGDRIPLDETGEDAGKLIIEGGLPE